MAGHYDRRMFTHRFRLILLPLFVALLSGPALAALVAVETDTPLKGVYLVSDDSADEVRVSAVMLAGEADSVAPEGLAHYIEHLMFWHADNVSQQDFHDRGGNAWINGIITTYYNEGPRAEMDALFSFAGRLMTPPLLDPDFMAEEKDIVAREYDLRVAENPRSKVRERLIRELFDNHPVSRSIIGTPESVASLTPGMVEQFRQRYYVPANMVLLVSGNIDENELRGQVERVFADIPAGEGNSQPWRDISVEGPLDLKLDITDDMARSEAFLFSSLSDWMGSGDRLQDLYILDFLGTILNSSLPGGLGKTMEIDEFIVSSYGVSLERDLTEQVQFWFSARPEEGIAPETVSERMRASMVELAAAGVPEASVERIRKRFLRRAERRGDEPRYILGRAMRNLTAGVEPNGPDDHARRINAITKADLDALVRTIAGSNRTVEIHLSGREA